MKMEDYESDVVSLLRRGSVSILEVIAMKLPEVFAAEILPKLDVFDTLSLAQVSKSYNDAVWSVDGVQSMKAKLKMYGAELKHKRPPHIIAEPMYTAACYGNLPAVRALLESGEDLNKPLHNGTTALHLCSSVDKPAKLKALIELGADINKQDIKGRTALSLASRFEQTLNVMELIKAGADVNLARHAGVTPLHMAAKNGHEACAAMLIQAGADIHRRTETGGTPIGIAIVNEHEKIAKLLRQLGARDD